MAREFRSILAVVASLIVAAFSATAQFVHFVHDVVTFDWHLDARASIALDGAMRSEVDVKSDTALQRAKAFFQRALNHPWWITDHFDPGRHVVSTA